ncbi:MAG: hypothetical protein KME26_24005 [Oscillatoria princeps RMCB-10]|nr:hypothetical protein [Oscillatoria princeps RMCB-10]
MPANLCKSEMHPSACELGVGYWALGVGYWGLAIFFIPMPAAPCPYAMPGARCPVPGARCPVPGGPCPLNFWGTSRPLALDRMATLNAPTGDRAGESWRKLAGAAALLPDAAIDSRRALRYNILCTF